MFLKSFFFLWILIVVSPEVKSAKILGVFHMCGVSQYLAGNSLMKILAQRGHDVTIISAFKENKPPPNFHQVIIEGQIEKLRAFRPNFFKRTFTTISRPFNFNKMSISLIEDMFNHTEFRKFIKSNQTFDVVIIEEFQSEAVKYLAHHFKAPLIVYSSMDANEWTNPYQGNPDNPAYIPNMFHKFSCRMSFLERVHNSIYYVYNNLVRILINIPMHNRLVQKYFPGAPHLNNIIYNVSLVLLNSDESVHGSIPKVPSMINIGGFHIKEPEPLPKDLQKLLDDATNGVIYFSLGTHLKSWMIPKEKLDLLLKIFSNLNETVLFKFEEDVPKKPANVIIRKWFPQSDVFAHKNVKLFITHGGLFGIMEAINYGIPLLSFPVFAEQHMNSERAAANGYGKYIPFNELSEEKLRTYLKDILENSKYKETAVKRSQIMKDKPTSPKDMVIFWVEYIIKYNGAPQLRVASLDLEWYQYLLLDVVLFISIVTLILVYLVKFLLKYLFGKSRKSKEKKS